jgi:hypothetical protein
MIRSAILCSFLLAASARAQDAPEPMPLGTRVENIQVVDLSGKPASLTVQGKITAVIWTSTTCPVSNDYNERMKALFTEYSPKGVQFAFINSNATELPVQVAQHAKDVQFGFPVWKDDGSALADRFGAQVTPHVFVFDADGVLRYRGAIDDSRNPARITKQPTRDALNALLVGQSVATPEVKAFGCTIKRAKKST